MTTHSELSPSRAHRWMHCPASIREEAKYPEVANLSNPAAADGTHSHTLLEYCIKQQLANPLDFVGMTLKDHEGSFVVDAERANRVKLAVDYIIAEVEKYSGACEVISETRVDPAWLVGRNDMSGTVDVQIKSSRIIELIDYKDGMAPVNAENNEQLLQYAIGVLASFKLPINGQYPIERFLLTIIQPKLLKRNLPAITSWSIDTADLLKLVGKWIAAAKATDDPNAPLVPGDSQCKYCKAKGNCNAVTNHVMEAVGMFKQIDIAHQAANQEPAELSDEKLREIVEAAPLLRQLLESVEAEALRRMKAGKSINGLKLVYGRGSRVWTLSDDEIAEKLVKMGVPKTSVYTTKIVSPAQVAKITWKKRDGTEKQLSERQIKLIEMEYIKRTTGNLTIASESDSRPAVVVDAAPMFSAVKVQEEQLPSWLL